MRWRGGGGDVCAEKSLFPSLRLQSPALTITVISCLQGGRGLQVAAQGPITAVTVVEAAIDIHGVLGVGGGWQ